MPASDSVSPFQVSNEARQPSGVLAVFRELLIAITFLVKSLLIQEYIFCCVSLHKSVFPPIYHPCCFSLNTLQRVSNLLIMMFSEPSASFQAQALSSPKDGLCLSAPDLLFPLTQFVHCQILHEPMIHCSPLHCLGEPQYEVVA